MATEVGSDGKVTVISSAEELRFAARAGDIDDVNKVLNRYKGESNELAKLLPAVVAATDELSGNSALHLCSANGHMDIIQLLLDHKAPIDAINLSGSTPLHYASLTGNLDIVKVLIQKGAKPVIENKYGKTALDEAHNGKHTDVAKFLIEHVDSIGSAPDLAEGDEQETTETT